MKLTLILFAILITAGCNQHSKNDFRKYLNEDNLKTQVFSIDTKRDTTIFTNAGIVVKIPAGSLESSTNPVTIEIKEALDIAAMLAAGLTTQTTQNETLSSAGMFYINAADGNSVVIKKPLETLLPTKTYNPEMQVWKGEANENNKIEWAEPAPLPDDETIAKITAGEDLYKANCASCHWLDRDLTGPRLYGITYRRSKKWLYDFTRNPEKKISGSVSDSATDYYANCLYNEYKPTVMSAFPNLTDNDLDNLYGYIKAETDKQPMPGNIYPKTCCDSCDLVRNEINKYYALITELVDDNEEFFNLDRTLPRINTKDDTIVPTTDIPDNSNEYVTPINNKATYYTVNVSALGWLNLDILLKNYNNCEPSELIVNVSGGFEEDFNVSLIIPDYKVFVDGGKLEDAVNYGFDESNGNIRLPQGATCTVIAFAEHDGKILFGKSSFKAKTKQTIQISVQLLTEEEMMNIIKNININEEIKIEIEDSKHSEEIRKTDKEMDSLYQLLPKNCDCAGFPETYPMPGVVGAN